MAEHLGRMLRRTAERYPDHIAIRTDRVELTFTELDRRVTRCARELTRLAGGRGHVIGVAAVLDPAFAIAYYAVVRSGNVVAIVNPLLREDGLRATVGASGARLLLACGEVAARARASSAVEHVADLDAVTAADGSEDGSAGPDDAGDPDDAACIQFTSGTTGRPKAVVLSHRNLVVNAAQIAEAHELDEHAISLNHLPTYHPMHLNSAVHAGALQVLCTSPSSADAIDLANRNEATHYYSLPVRLARLAADPGLPDLRLRTVGRVLSGGSALPVPAARTLSEHFGIPVLQGYGLAETSPLTHVDSPQHPRIGSVGQPVSGTECRVTDLATGQPLPAGERGEVQVRGPQLMRGYLGEPPLEPGAWFATGDVGRIDEDGYLFLVDRLKDVFKCDNWLVAPSEIEEVLLAVPGVADAAVVDAPDPFSGAVAHAFIVVRDGADPTAIQTSVNARMPYYQHIRDTTVVERIPRSGIGKIQRRELRERLRPIPEEEALPW
ncbi:AMP-binding protein [Crossiella sp. CA-258035]|uniref:class I adenylate-forming enzyme family protein n=1 Tax=Crossiella sp. CA-258035 TaxID=2981138 RepID=UPI0024BC1F17|nr:AMP-binding protein [Crossiella sp. CA-258035]WHT23332.1 AMP-binding protein [Crossiella sp. CA-258035]